MIFLFGLFESSPAEFPSELLIRVTDEAELPDLKGTRPIPGRPGWKAGLYHEAKFGSRPGKCDVKGHQAVEAVKDALGEPLAIETLDETRPGYFWRWHENPSKGLLILVSDTPPSIHLRGWSLRPKATGSRLGRDVEGQVYRWFDTLIGR